MSRRQLFLDMHWNPKLLYLSNSHGLDITQTALCPCNVQSSLSTNKQQIIWRIHSVGYMNKVSSDYAVNKTDVDFFSLVPSCWFVCTSVWVVCREKKRDKALLWITCKNSLQVFRQTSLSLMALTKHEARTTPGNMLKLFMSPLGLFIAASGWCCLLRGWKRLRANSMQHACTSSVDEVHLLFNVPLL